MTPGSKRTASIDITQQNVTGINHWWSYEEGSIPGVGRWMINANSGNLIVQADDMDVPHRGVDLAFRRTYNSFSRHDFAGYDGANEVGQYGNGWTNTWDAHLSTNGCPNTGYSWAGFYGFTVHDIDGARYDYCFNSTGQLIAPPGMQSASLVVSPDGGSFYWTKKTGTQYTFYAPYYSGTSAAYSGRIYRISGRNQNNYIQFSYAWSPDASSSANLTNIYAATDDGGSQATLTFANFSGQQLLWQLTRPDGATITYDYDTAGELISVAKPAPNNSGTPAIETYNGYQSFLMVAGPRWNAGSENDGGYVAFYMDETTTAQVDGIEWVGVMNFQPSDGTSTLLQPAVATGPIIYRWEDVRVTPTYTSFTDTDRHSAVQYLDGAGRPTARQEYTGSQWLQTIEGWDAANNLATSIDARGNESDYLYDPMGNTIAVGEPLTTTSQGTIRPTRIYDYDGFNNVLAYCDENEAHAANADWTPISYSVKADDSLCSSQAGSVAHWRATYSYPSYEPFGELQSMSKPLGYTHTFVYDPSQQGGNDYGLPTAVTGGTISQFDGSSVTPMQAFWYDSVGNLRCYSKGQGLYVLTYDGLGRLVSNADPDDTSANTTSACGKTAGQPGWNTQTTTTYFPDGSKASTQTPSERAFGVSTTYTYDPDGNLATETQHHGCVPNQTCPDGTTRKWYDGADRLVEVAQPHDTRTLTNPVANYDGDPWLTRYLYDLSSGGVVTMTGSAPFTAYGNLFDTQTLLLDTSWTDVRGSAFDAVDRETSKFSYSISVTPGVSDRAHQLETTGLQYDLDATSLGMLSKKTNPNNESVQYLYDPHGRIVHESYAGDAGRTPAESYVYDASGRAVSITSSQFGVQQYSFDADGRLATSSEPNGGGLTSPAQISYGYYANGMRSAVSVTSTGITQLNALTYSYRVDGLLRTQTVSAFSSGMWNRQYTDAGRLIGVSGVDTQSRTYDTSGQLVNYAVSAGTVNYTHDPEGSVLTEYLPNVLLPGAGSPSPETIANTLNTRGELVDRGAPIGGGTTHRRMTTNSGCTATSTIPALLSDYDPSQDWTLDPGFCDRVNGISLAPDSSVQGLLYNGSEYLSGTKNTEAFDASGRVAQTVHTEYVFTTTGGGAGDKPLAGADPPPPDGLDTGGGPTGAMSATKRTTTVRTYDFENHLVTSQSAMHTTGLYIGGSAKTFDVTGPPLSVGWGPNGHPVSIGYSRWSSSMGNMTAHWDGDMILFVTDSSGNVIDFKAGLDGDITPRDVAFTGLSVYDRDAAGVIVETSNATGTTGFSPIDPSTVAGAGAGGTANYRGAVVQLQYVRSDGFLAAGVEINGVRAYDPNLGVWTTPDAYEGEVHDPASQQRYMWNHGNAYDYRDPSGYDALISKEGSGVVITLLVSFIGGTDAQRQMVKNGIEKQWTNEAYGLKTVVVEVPRGISMNTIVIKSGGETNVYPTGARGTMNYMNINPDDKNIAYGIAHESGHLLGIQDHYKKIVDENGKMIGSPTWTGYEQDVMGAFGKFGISTTDIWEILTSKQNIHLPMEE
jgi:YD repeat-containing protein